MVSGTNGKHSVGLFVSLANVQKTVNMSDLTMYLFFERPTYEVGPWLPSWTSDESVSLYVVCAVHLPSL